MASTPTLVFGDDSSPASDIAWLFINNQAWPGWRVEIVTAHMPDMGPPPAHELAELHHWDPPRPRRAFTEALFSEIAHLTAEGDPRLVLSRESDLLVIGPRGPGLLKALHLGGTADWLLLHPPAPLLVARQGHAVRSVVVCTDGSPHAHRVTDVLAGLPWADQLDVTVLAIDDNHIDVDGATRVAAERLRAAGATVDVCVQPGKATPRILGHLEQHPPDLVALGIRGLTSHRLRHRHLGPTTSAVARTATCSVLVACDEDEPLGTIESDR